MASDPHFSIITPMFNRATTIGRAIRSCLDQPYCDFELVIVDDGSTDGSAEAASSFSDSRIRILSHEQNLGPCPARNTAIARARGRWCIMLDSDFSLMPGALANLAERTSKAGDDIGNVASCCLWDDGRISPAPYVADGPLDFAGYIHWVSSVVISEYFNCVRREVFKRIAYPESRAWEFEFHINLARSWLIELSRDVAVKIHTDAGNRLTDRDPSALWRELRDAQDKLASLERILIQHGREIRRCSTAFYEATLTRAAYQAFVSGDRRKGLRYLIGSWAQSRSSLAWWGVAFTGLLGRRATATAALRRRRT